MSSPRSSGDEDDDTKYNDTMDDGDKPDVRALDQAPAGPSSSPPAARSKQTVSPAGLPIVLAIGSRTTSLLVVAASLTLKCLGVDLDHTLI